MNLEGKIVMVVGSAKSGQAVAHLAYEAGASIRVTDRAGSENIDADFREWLSSIDAFAEFDGHTEEIIDGSDLVVISPGVRLDAAPVQWAQEKGIPIVGELEFAFQFCSCPIVAVTGSNGKTTVTTLIGRVLQESGKDVFIGGNIGEPLSGSVLELTADHVAVVEVSSFQMETVEQFNPHVAVFLNISQNHLDRHADMDEYFNLKERIFENQTPNDFAVLNAGDERVASLADRLASQVVWFNNEEQRRQAGHENPNFLAVDAVASIFGVHQDFCQKVFEEFRGIAHRMETVREINGVAFINDSKSTTTEASRWALAQSKGPIVWICGGRDKNLDFSVLRDIVNKKVKKILAIGEAADKIKKAFADIIDVECVENFDESIRKAFSCADSGEVVLFSPMCASFDMFKNFEHRGEEFKKVVNAL